MSKRKPSLVAVLAVCVCGLFLLLGALSLLSKGKVRNSLRSAIVGTEPASPDGHWNPMRPPLIDESLSTDQQNRIKQLLSLGYTGGTRLRSTSSGVTALDTTLASRGLRFYISGHRPQALLMTREGDILHTWQYDYHDLWDARPDTLPPPSSATGCWRRARLLPDGDLLAIYEGRALIKLDRDSRLLWFFPGKCHHDLDIDEDGSIYVLTRSAGIVPRLHPDEPVLLDAVVVLDSDGAQIREISLIEAFENSSYAYFLPKPPAAGDLFHTNTLELLDGRLADRSPAFRDGNILISVRELDVIAVLDPDTERIVWATTGGWSRQHEPTVLSNGRMLLFDNLGYEGYSQVIEFDPISGEIAWSYANGPTTPLYSKTCGAAQRLANDNTLIVESDNGRAFEVTPDMMIVWEYYNPYRAGEHNELIAAVLDMCVLPDGPRPVWLADTISKAQLNARRVASPSPN